MQRKRISTGSSFEELAGYCRAIVDGEWVFVGGTTGYDYATMSISDDVAEQVAQTFRNIEWALGEAGADKGDIVQIRVYVADRDDFPTIAPLIGDWCRDVRPVNTTVVTPLVAPEMKVEIEVTAKRQV